MPTVWTVLSIPNVFSKIIVKKHSRSKCKHEVNSCLLVANLLQGPKEFKVLAKPNLCDPGHI